MSSSDPEVIDTTTALTEQVRQILIEFDCEPYEIYAGIYSDGVLDPNITYARFRSLGEWDAAKEILSRVAEIRVEAMTDFYGVKVYSLPMPRTGWLAQ